MTKEYRKFKMTRKRADWVSGRSTKLRGEPMRVNNAFAERMADNAQSMVYKMNKDVTSQINKLFSTPTAKNSITKVPDEITTNDFVEDGIAMDASIASQSRILMNKLIKKWENKFNLFGNNFAKNMVGTVTKQSAKDLKRSTEKLSGGLSIKTDSLSDRTKDIIIASTDESASLIKTIATNYTTEVKEAVSRSISSNTGSFTSLKESINSMLQDKYKKHKNKAKNVALDQTRKAYSNIAASKMKDIGVTSYVWKHSGGSQNPRAYHKNVLNGQVFKLSEPPIINQSTGERGKPGDDYNCKCYMSPVIEFN